MRFYEENGIGYNRNLRLKIQCSTSSQDEIDSYVDTCHKNGHFDGYCDVDKTRSIIPMARYWTVEFIHTIRSKDTYIQKYCSTNEMAFYSSESVGFNMVRKHDGEWVIDTEGIVDKVVLPFFREIGKELNVDAIVDYIKQIDEAGKESDYFYIWTDGMISLNLDGFVNEDGSVKIWRRNLPPLPSIYK